MEIGIGLPATIPGMHGRRIIEWARRADAGPFSSLGIIDRIVYPNHEPLVTLAAAAGATERIRLMTTVLVAPARDPVYLAKQAATIDSLSNGRLTLGLGVGGREDDFLAVGASFHGRGKRLEEQLAIMQRVRNGEAPYDDVGPVGPPPVQAGGPPILLGGYSPAAVNRLARWGVGFISAGGDPSSVSRLFEMARKAWAAGGRSGSPRLVGSIYCAVAPDDPERARAYIRHYYAFLGPGGDAMANAIPTTADAIRRAIDGYAAAGADEVVLWPCLPDLDQVDRFAEIVG